MIMIGLAPLIIVGLVVSLTLGEPLLFVGGLVVAAAIVGFGVQHQKSVSRRRYSSEPDDWMSRTSFYVGPFDHSGLPGAVAFERLHSRYNNPPQVRLLVTDHGIVFGPSGHSGTPLSVSFSDLVTIDLIEGTRPRMLVITPPMRTRWGRLY
jgi:hypothetical protein